MAGNKSLTFSNDFLKLIFQGTAIANLAQNGTSPLTSLYVALHTADPTASGNQNNFEATYTPYARQAVARTSSGWTVPTTGTLGPVANVVFPAPTGTPTDVLTHFSVGVAASGATKILYSGPLSVSIAVSAGNPPTLLTTTAITEK